MVRLADVPPKRPGRPRLVHLTTTDMSLEWLLGPQLRAFADAGYEVIGASAPGSHVAALEAMGIPHVALPAFTRSNDPRQDLRAARQLVQLLRTLRPDILHTHNPKPGILGRVLGRLLRVPLVVNTQHGLYAQPTDRWQRRIPVYAAERVAAAFSHVELVQNPEDVDTLVDTLRVPRRRVHLLGNGIDLTRFAPASLDPGARARLRAEWGIAPDELLCGTVSRLVQEKGIVELLEAAHTLRAERPRLRLVVVGPVELDKADAIDPALIERARAEGVVFAGRRDDMPECYAAMDLFVLASWREGFPRAAMEAAAMGLPTIGTDIRGTRQVIDDGVTGVLVPVRNAAAIAASVRSLVDDEAKRTTMSAAAGVRARAEFDQQRVIDITLQAYRQR